MKTYYTYGDPSLVVKQVMKNSWANNCMKFKVNLKQAIRLERKRLKGCFIERMSFSDNESNLILPKLCNVNNLSFYALDMTIKKIIVSCFTTYRTVTENLHYMLPDMEFTKIRADIVNAVLDPVINSEFHPKSLQTIIAYKENFIKNYEATILNAKETAYTGWNNGKPSKIVMDMFPNGYVYGHRDTSNKKWNWLKNKAPEQVVKGFIDQGVTELSPSMKTALKRVQGLSIKVVNDLLKKTVSEMDPSHLKRIKNNKAINDWFNNFDDVEKREISEQITRKRNDEHQIKAYINYMINEYGYNKEWIVDGKLKFTPQIKEFIDSTDTTKKEI